MTDAVHLLPLVVGTLWLAWSNGANDNFKGVATLYGSRTLGYRAALAWASLATLAGCVCSIVLAHGLVATFSGQGLLTNGAIGDTALAAVGMAAGATVLLATWLGLPTSTTHALAGALVGAALLSGPAAINGSVLLSRFAQPLLLSPLLAIGLTVLLYHGLHSLRVVAGIGSESCLCVGEVRPHLALGPARGVAANVVAVVHTPPAPIALSTGTQVECAERYTGAMVGVRVQTAVDVLHVLSAGAVCFARSVNDTPKIAAILLTAGAARGVMSGNLVLVLVSLAVLAGGIVQSRKVAQTMSRRITELNTGQGLTASLVTATLVLGASRLGVPVSTTHVSCGAIFGIGAVNGRRDWSTIGKILAAWVTTLPLALGLGAALHFLLAATGA